MRTVFHCLALVIPLCDDFVGNMVLLEELHDLGHLLVATHAACFWFRDSLLSKTQALLGQSGNPFLLASTNLLGSLNLLRGHLDLRQINMTHFQVVVIVLVGDCQCVKGSRHDLLGITRQLIAGHHDRIKRASTILHLLGVLLCKGNSCCGTGQCHQHR